MENDADMQGLTKVQQEELKEELLSHRTLKTTGSRPSNRSAALDYRTTVERLNTEVSDLCHAPFLAHATIADDKPFGTYWCPRNRIL